MAPIRKLAIAALFTLALAARTSAARAQQPAAAPDAGEALDAVIMVQPEGDRAEVSVAYSHAIPAGDVKQTLARLARLGGWRMGSVSVKDEAPTPGARIQTGASAVITGKSLVAPGGFRLQPFVDAFSALDRFELIYVVARQPWFQGLTHFENPVVSIDLTSADGPYRYNVVVHDHLAAIPKLPITQQSVAAVVPAPARPAQSGAAPVWPLIALALCCGLAVYAALRLLTARRVENATPRRGASPDRRAGRSRSL